MGRARYLKGQWEQANPWFERCSTLCPNNALAYYNQALISTVSGITDTTQDLSEKALSLSPIDPFQYAFLATRAMGCLADGPVRSAAYWAEQAANAPRAHHLIDAIAAAACMAAGQKAKAEAMAQRLTERVSGFTSEQFFRSLPVHTKIREQLAVSFTELGFE